MEYLIHSYFCPYLYKYSDTKYVNYFNQSHHEINFSILCNTFYSSWYNQRYDSVEGTASTKKVDHWSKQQMTTFVQDISAKGQGIYKTNGKTNSTSHIYKNKPCCISILCFVAFVRKTITVSSTLQMIWLLKLSLPTKIQQWTRNYDNWYATMILHVRGRSENIRGLTLGGGERWRGVSMLLGWVSLERAP